MRTYTEEELIEYRRHDFYDREDAPRIKPEYSSIYAYEWDRDRHVQRRCDVENYDIKHVQAFINNIATPRSLEELEWFIKELGHFDVEDLLIETETSWTAPFWAKPGDIVFFMHAKSSRDYLMRLRRELRSGNHRYSSRTVRTMETWIDRGIKLHSLYGGKIYAVARVCKDPEVDLDHVDIFHWKSHLYADMNQVTVLQNPIPVDEFKDVVSISMQTAITPVFGEGFYKIRDLIRSKNRIPHYLEISDATPMPLMKIDRRNWLVVNNEFNRNYPHEAKFRKYYVDYLLPILGDQKKIFAECKCTKPGIHPSYIDNVILIGRKYLPVEVKLSVEAQHDIKGQVRKYCYDQVIELERVKSRRVQGSYEIRTAEPEKIHSRYCLVIDTEKMYLFDYDTDLLDSVVKLDDVKTVDDVMKVKAEIKRRI